MRGFGLPSSDDRIQTVLMEVALPRLASSARVARQRTAGFLADLARLDLVPDSSLVVTELVTNAFLHGGDPIRLTVEMMDGGLRIAVFDGDCRVEWVSARPVDSAEPGGRGLHVVSMLAACWGTTELPDGKIVWAELATSTRG